MKKIISFVFIVAALVFAASCINERVSLEEGDGVFTLRLQTAALETRADAPTEEEIENTVTHADFFFFSDEEGTTLLNHTRLEVKNGELVAKGNNIYEYTFDVSSEDNPLKKTSYLYVIANYPGTISAETLEDILALDIMTDLNGKFTSFVMDSYDSSNGKVVTKLTPSKPNDDKEVTIGLTRAAAKLVLNINVKDSYTDAAENVWTPVTEQMWANFVNARKAAIVEAAPVNFDAKANYFNTKQETPVSTTAAKEGYTSWKTSAVYTYPQNYTTDDVHAPYFKIFCPWTCEKKGMCNFYYKIILPNLNSFQRNKVYNLTLDLSVIGGTEDEWALVTEYIYVADWWAPDAIEAVFEGAGFLDVPVKTYHIYGIDYVTVPVVSSNPITVSGSPTDTSVTVTGTKQNLYGTNGNGVPYDETVTPTISEITKDGFKLTHLLNTTVSSEDYDFTPITYTLYVNHDQDSDGALNKPIEVKIVQYPSIYAEADKSNGYAYVNSYAYTNNHGGRHDNNDLARNNNSSNWNILGSMADIEDAGNQNPNQYVVHVSVLPSDYTVAGLGDNVVIGDPRGEQLSENYLGYTSGTNGDPDLTVKTHYSATSSDKQNVIAPVIRIASSWGATFQIVDFDRAEERCAAYQENGYPAGRWRIPTVAEIDFLIQLSTYEHIPALFTTVKQPASGNYTPQHYRGYWAGGRNLYLGKPYTDDGNTSPFVDMTSAETYQQNNNYYMYNYLRIPSGNNYTYYQARVRCVYDEWYWGGEKYDNSGTQIEGSNVPSSTANPNAAKQWLGYIY